MSVTLISSFYLVTEQIDRLRGLNDHAAIDKGADPVRISLTDVSCIILLVFFILEAQLFHGDTSSRLHSCYVLDC